MDRRLSGSDVAELTNALFSAALDPKDWQGFLEVLSCKSGGVRTHMFGFDIRTKLTLNILGHGYSDETIKSFQDHYYKYNAWAPGFARAAAGTVMHSQNMMPLEALEKTAFYHEWVKPQGDVCGGGGAMLFKGRERTIMLGGNIRRKDTESLEENWLSLIAMLLPHIQQAFQLNRALFERDIEKSYPYDGVGECIPSPGFLFVNRMGRLLFANDVAEDMLARGKLVCSGFDNLVKSPVPEFQAELELAKLVHVNSLTNRSYSARAFIEGVGAVDFQAMCVLAPTGKFPFAFAPSEPCVLLAIYAPQVGRHLDASAHAPYGLTPAETEIIFHLAQGASLRQISDIRRTSTNTIRNQIGYAMQKTGVKSQCELALLAMRLLS